MDKKTEKTTHTNKVSKGSIYLAVLFPVLTTYYVYDFLISEGTKKSISEDWEPYNNFAYFIETIGLAGTLLILLSGMSYFALSNNKRKWIYFTVLLNLGVLTLMFIFLR